MPFLDLMDQFDRTERIYYDMESPTSEEIPEEIPYEEVFGEDIEEEDIPNDDEPPF